MRLIKEEENFDSNKHESVDDKQEEQGNWVSGSTGMEPGFIPEGGQSWKPKKKIMKIKTNIYFIFNRILHIK